jgi:hypothetical protein
MAASTKQKKSRADCRRYDCGNNSLAGGKKMQCGRYREKNKNEFKGIEQHAIRFDLDANKMHHTVLHTKLSGRL